MIEKEKVVLVGDKSGALDPDKRNARTSKYTSSIILSFSFFFYWKYLLYFTNLLADFRSTLVSSLPFFLLFYSLPLSLSLSLPLPLSLSLSPSHTPTLPLLSHPLTLSHTPSQIIPTPRVCTSWLQRRPSDWGTRPHPGMRVSHTFLYSYDVSYVDFV